MNHLTPLAMVAAANSAAWWPFVILAISVLAIIVLVTRLRVHPFLALVGVAVLTGLLAPVGTLPGEPEKSHWVQAVEVTTAEFGAVCGRVGVVIALAAIIGACIMESGAADKVVRRFLALFGEKRAGVALLSAGFPLGLPIFFDTFFMLLVPIARALRLRTGRDYVLFVLAICCAGGVTHSLVAPHPGPLAMAEILKIDLGWSIIAGTLASIPAVAAGWVVARRINRHLDIPLRETSGASLKDLEEITLKPEHELPGLVASLTPVLLPIVLISTASFLAAFSSRAQLGGLYVLLEFLGNRNVALLIGTVMAMLLVVRYRRMSASALGQLLGRALETAGVIILITSAGGAFGLMLKHAGVGEAIRLAVAGREVNLIVLAWTLGVVMKFAQGSATVAMLASSAMLAGILQGVDLPYHPMYIFLAIGFGALGISWMNDSGFWVIGRLSGFTERETLRTWTVTAFTMALAGLIETLILAKLLPFK